MMGFERRWARALLAAFAPPLPPGDGSASRRPLGLSPAPGEVDFDAMVQRLLRGSTKKAAFGLRAAIWLAALAPLWLWGRVTTVTRLATERRVALLEQLLGHRSFVVRELALLLKFCAAMALLGTPSVRDRSGYDNPVAPPSGLLARLPVLDNRGAQLSVRPANDGTTRGRSTHDIVGSEPPPVQEPAHSKARTGGEA